MTSPPIPKADLFRRGKEWYDKLRPLIETDENIGKQITINVQTGDYEIHDDFGSVAACDRLFEKDANAALFGFRIGYNAVYSLGGMLTRTTPL